ncbi:MAG TPA: YqgE/AlgH family protein [Bryobacteraceae bacterium]|jgi:putative transcriptional regulator
MKPLILLFAFMGEVCLGGGPAPQRFESNVDKLVPGCFLVAPREAMDNTFAETVILLIHRDDNGAMGLAINRPTKIAVSRVLDDAKDARNLNDFAYAGGPVQQESVFALSRMSKKPGAAERIFNDIYLIATRDELSKVLRAKPTTKNFRVYLGYTGWGPGQLEHEMELGAWRILPGDDESVFDDDPSKVWPRLIDRTEMRFVRLFATPSANQAIR